MGVLSSVTILNKVFLNRIKSFPTQIHPEKDPETHKIISSELQSKYGLSADKYAFGWPDYNLVKHAERINKLSSLFVTHLDLLDDLPSIKVCNGYERDVDGKTETLKGWMPCTISELG